MQGCGAAGTGAGGVVWASKPAGFAAMRIAVRASMPKERWIDMAPVTATTCQSRSIRSASQRRQVAWHPIHMDFLCGAGIRKLRPDAPFRTRAAGDGFRLRRPLRLGTGFLCAGYPAPCRGRPPVGPERRQSPWRVHTCRRGVRRMRKLNSSGVRPWIRSDG